MLKKAILTTVIFGLGTSFAYAAGSEINAQIVQKNKADNSKIIGASDAQIDLGKIPVIGGITSGKIKGEMSINTIENKSGKIGGTITQNNKMDETVAVSSQINKIVNDNSTITDRSYISQDNEMDGTVIVGAKVNQITNKK